MQPTQQSLDILQEIGKTVHIPHYHSHILYDIAKTYPDYKCINYVEIGCLAGGTACLMLQRPLTLVATIDLGTPVSKEIPIANMDTYNIHNNRFFYIKGNSHSVSTKQSLKIVCKDIDILFIDGGHCYEDVIQDFFYYKDLVSMFGYIVFDDYNHPLGCPDVRRAVDELMCVQHEDYSILGTYANTIGAPGVTSENKEGNCFVLRRIK